MERWTPAVLLVLAILATPAVSAADGGDVGYLTVTSSPTGAVVYVDSESLGVTPVTGYALSIGSHQLTADLIGYKEVSQTFTLGSGEQRSIALQMVPIAPTLPPTTVTTAPTTIPFTTYTIPPTTRPETTITIGGGKGWITTHCNVNGASVSFDGNQGCRISNGECTVEVGTTWAPYRTFTVSAPGYQTYTGSVTRWPSEGQTVDLYATLNPVQPTSGSIVVSSSPSGAGIYLNGNFQGYAPMTIPDLAPATYTLAAKLNGYTSVSQYVTVYSGQTSYFSPVLNPSPQPRRDTGTVYFSSSPGGASVSVDGTYRGTTPITVSLYTGSHSVLMRMSGYADWTNTVYVSADSQQSMFAQLSQNLVYGYVSISANPPGANVYFDSVYKGQTDSSGSFTVNGVQPGSHALRLTKPGYNDYQTTVSVTANQGTYVQAALTPQGGGPTPTPDQGTGTVSIVSSPTGAEVYLDNLFMGYSPITLNNVAAGSRTVMVKAQGYLDYIATVQVQAGSTTPLTVTLLPGTPQPTQSGTGLPAIPGMLGALAVLLFIRRRC